MIVKILGLTCLIFLNFFNAGAQSAVGKEIFTEGVIKARVSIPGNMIGTVMGKIDYSKGNAQEQMEAIMSKWTDAEMKKYQADVKKAGLLLLSLASMPMQYTVWCRGALASSRYDAANYHGESYVDTIRKIGLMFMQSSRTGTALTIGYNNGSLQQATQKVLNSSDYDIVKTKETAVVAGYLCTKSVYTLRSQADAKPGQLDATPDSKAYRLEVWTSSRLPKTLNFMHPLYIEEEDGIMKLLVTYDKKASLQLLYEFTSVESKHVTTDDLTIKKTDPIHDSAQIAGELWPQIMGILMGVEP